MAPSSPSHNERLTEWVREHAQAVRGYLMAVVRDPHTADDLLQETFCRAWESRSRYVDEGKPRAYLLRIADRLAVDRLRRRGRERPLDDVQWRVIEPTDEGEPADGRLVGREAGEELAAALAALSEPQRRTLLMRYYGDMDFEQVADTLGCPTNTALSHARRGLAALRRLLIKESP